MDALRDDLISRWKRSFDRITEITADPPRDLEKVYTVYPAYALDGYTPKRFKPGARISRTKADYTFHRDDRGRPLYVSYGHRDGGRWRGRYWYADDEVEQIEVYVNRGVPNLYGRLVLEDGVVVSEQRLVVNCGGSLPNLPKKNEAEAILADPGNYFLYLTRYRIEGGRPVSGEELHEVSGQVYRPTLEHLYSDSRLERILQHWPGGETRTLYKARSK